MANPKTGLILDEPTNDLDLETLDMLTEMLSNYNGTLLIVSHDRDFLDQTVNKILHFDHSGNVSLFLGGYSDFLKSQTKPNTKKTSKKNKNQKDNATKQSKLSYKYQHELDNLPKEITLIQEELEYVTNELKKSNMYLENHTRYLEITKKMEILNKELTLKEDRWLEILEIEESIKNG